MKQPSMAARVGATGVAPCASTSATSRSSPVVVSSAMVTMWINHTRRHCVGTDAQWPQAQTNGHDGRSRGRP